MNNNRDRVILRLKIITTIASAIYAAGLLVSLMLARGTTPDTLTVDRNVAGSSQVVICLLLVTATVALWILPRKAQIVLAILFVCAIGIAGYDWWTTTTQIKANTGTTTAGLSTTLIGATWFDVVALIALVCLIASTVTMVVRGSTKQSESPKHPFRLGTSAHH